MQAGLLSTSQFSLYRDAVALIPFGAFEQHGPHLPLLTDTLIAEAIAARVEEKRPTHILRFPALWFGDSSEHRGFPGTLSVSAPQVIQVLDELFQWIDHAGLRRGILFNAHGGNLNLAATACEAFSRGHEFKVRSVFAYSVEVKQRSKELFGVSETHAGSTETSLLFALHPELRSLKEGFHPNAHPYPGGGRLNLFETRELSPDGILQRGDRLEVDQAKGEQLAQAMVTSLNQEIDHLIQLIP